MHNRRSNRQKKRFWQRMQALFLVVFLILLILIGVRLLKEHSRSAEEQAAAISMDNIPAEEALSAPEIFPEAQELLEQNADFVGMVGFGEMSFYVCQGEDNFYYASHRFDVSEDESGMIYMDCRNSILPVSDNIILYGHNMRDGSRFGTLNRFEDVDFLLEHPFIRFASLYEVNDYYPISVFHTTADKTDDDYFNFARISFADEADFDRYISEAKARSVYYIPTTAEYGDQLLTLATCSSISERGRLVVLCRKSE